MTIADPLKSKQPIKNRKNRKKQSKLVNAACAGLLGAGMVSACGTANADTFNELSVAGGDFGNIFELAYDLPPRADKILGVIESNTAHDYFRWNDLEPGTTFTATGNVPLNSLFTLFKSSDQFFPLAEDIDNTVIPTINVSTVVPLDGKIVANLQGTESGGAYTLNVDATFVPEPGSATFLSLGAAGLLGLRRRKS